MFLSLLQFFATKFLFLALHLESGSFPRPLSPQEEIKTFSDTFALAGVAGFAGIDGNGVGSFGHEILLSCCPVAVDAAIVTPTA